MDIDTYGAIKRDQQKIIDKYEAEVARLTARVAELERNAKWIEAHPQGVDSLNFTVFAEDMFGNWRCCACLEEWCLFDEVTPQESNIKYCPSCGSVIQAYQDYGKEDDE